MAQHDMNIANQSFPSFRSDLNNALTALNSMHSGTNRPSGATTGTLWLDTTNAGSNSLTMKFFDGTDDISIATVDTSANTINFLDSTVSADIVGDTSPQLGGNLDVNGNSIVSTSNGNISITPNGSGKVILDGLSHPTADGTSGQVLKTDGSGNLSFTTVASDVSGDSTPQLGGDLDVNGNSIVSTSNGNIAITPNGSGNIVLDGLTFPNADGSADQFLKTNGSGTLSFDTAGGGKVLQVVTAQKTDTFSTSSTSDTTVTGLSLNITPSATTSKILVMINLSACMGSFTDSDGSNSNNRVNIFRGSTNIVDDLVTSPGSRTGTLAQHGFRKFQHIEALHFHLVDTPSTTSQLTYTVKVKARSSTIFVNKMSDDAGNNNANIPRGISTLTCLEIGA